MEREPIGNNGPRRDPGRRNTAFTTFEGLARLLAALLLLGLWALTAAPLGSARQAAPRWTEAWRVETAGYVAQSPVVTPERVYAVGGSTLFAIDAADGRVVWTKGTGEGFGLGPTLAEDALFVANQDGALSAFRAEDGVPLWQATELGWASSRPVVDGDTLYVNAGVGQRGITLAFDAATGRELWRTDRESAGAQAPGVLGDTLFTGDSDPETGEPVVLALDAATGDELWRTDREARLFFRGVSETSGQVYAGAYEGELVALDPEGGERWRRDPGTGLTWTSGGPAEADGVLYAATNTGQGGGPGEDPAEPGVAALDPGSGEVLWRTPLGAPGGVWYGPVVAGDGLVVAPGAPPVPVLVDRASGRVRGGLPWPASAHPRAFAAGPGLVVAGYQSTEDDFPGLIALRPSTPTRPSRGPATTPPSRTPGATAVADPARTPAAPATPTTGSASLTVRAFGCPVAYDGDDYAAAGTEPLAGIGDGLTDFAGVGFEPGSATGTDPLNPDTDGDGTDDAAELANGTDPTNPASV